jgi:hypothetical protein
MTPVVWVWVAIFAAIAVLGAVVTWRSVKLVWTNLKALGAEVSGGLDRLAATAAFLDRLGTPTPFVRSSGQRGELEPGRRAARSAPLRTLVAADDHLVTWNRVVARTNDLEEA